MIKSDFKTGEIVDVKLSLLKGMAPHLITEENIWQKHIVLQEELDAEGYLDFLIEFDMIRKI